MCEVCRFRQPLPSQPFSLESDKCRVRSVPGQEPLHVVHAWTPSEPAPLRKTLPLLLARVHDNTPLLARLCHRKLEVLEKLKLTVSASPAVAATQKLLPMLPLVTVRCGRRPVLAASEYPVHDEMLMSPPSHLELAATSVKL